jgi:hypothetical protein
MCGCDCCQNSDPTCFDPQMMEANGSFHGWACRCSCPGCIARVIDGAMAVGYGNAMDDGWGEPEHIKAAVAAARTEGYYEGRASNIRNLRDAQRDERARIRAAVEALAISLVNMRLDMYDEDDYQQAVLLSDVIAVIDGETQSTQNEASGE